MKTPKAILLMLVAVGLASIAGCDGSTAPIGDPVVFDGVITPGARVIHPLVLKNSGTVRIEFNRIVEQPVEGVDPLNVIWRLGMGVGRPSAGECPTSYSVRASVGQLVVLGLNEAEYCLLVFDNGILPDGRILEYTVTLSPGS